MAVQFDTLRYFETLKSTGVPERQAIAKVEALAMALGEWAPGLLATRDGITEIKVEMTKIRGQLKLLRWMVAISAVGIASLVAKAFF